MRMPRRSLPFSVLVAILSLTLVGGVVWAASSMTIGRVGPKLGLLNSGRALHPEGSLTRLGNFPTGGRLTPDGKFLWTVSAGRGLNDIRIVSVASGKVVQVIQIPGASGGIAMDPAHPVAYISGVHDSSISSEAMPDGTPGKNGDVIHVYRYDAGSGQATFDKVLPVPPPADAPRVANFPTTQAPQSWPDRLAVSADGGTLLVPLNLAKAAAIIDTATQAVRYVNTGGYPYGAAILPDGKTGLVSNETSGTVSVIDMAAGTKTKDIQVGPPFSHPEAIVLDPKAARAYVPLANSDQVAVIDTGAMNVQRTLSVERPQGLGASPVDAAVTPDGKRLLVANAGTDELVNIGLPAGRKKGMWKTTGRIPTSLYPTAVDVTPTAVASCGKTGSAGAKKCMKVVYVTGKGVGVGPNLNGPQPNGGNDSDAGIAKTQYLPLLNIGQAGIADLPDAKRLAKITPVAAREIMPTNAQKAPKGTPLRKNGPIKHVFYIVKENRTYDQVLGDDPRGDGDKKLALFGANNTPNAHALVKRFPLVDHLYGNSEASIDGHFWTSAAKVSDYVNKSWFQNYGGRKRPYDYGVFSVTWPANGFLFDQARRQGVSFFNYGEALAGVLPNVPGIIEDTERTAAQTAGVLVNYKSTDVNAAFVTTYPGHDSDCYANDSSIGQDSILGTEVFDSAVPAAWANADVPAGRKKTTSRFDCFNGRLTKQLAANAVPKFNYLVLTNDHTQTLSAGKRTPQAMIADNDEAVGRIVDRISHSSIWKSSAIFVVEDDSQDGPDHVDAHRMPAFVISPFAPKGKVVHTRYDQVSMVRSLELILGLKPLGLFDAVATPMYDAFGPKATNAAPYTFIPSKVDLTALNPAGTAGARLAARQPTGLDQISRRVEDSMLWKSVHGWKSVPPPAGPNAVKETGGEPEG